MKNEVNPTNKNEKLQDAIGMIGDDLIKDAEKTKKRYSRHIPVIAAVLAIVITLSSVLIWLRDRSPVDNTGKDIILSLISNASYPVMAQHPHKDLPTDEYNNKLIEWSESRAAQTTNYYADPVNITNFTSVITQEFMSDSDGDNIVYSPVNTYIMLGMLAEITDGESHNQIMSLLGYNSIEELRKDILALWQANYCDDGIVTSILANSLWLNKNVSYNTDTLNTLSKNYYTSSYSGQMGSAEYNNALRSWIKNQTGGILEKETNQLSFSSETVMALLSTVYFKATWEETFLDSRTEKSTFYTSEGKIECDFLNNSIPSYCYWGDNFTAVKCSLEESGGMYIILPDENVNIENLIHNNEMQSFISCNGNWENKKEVQINLSLPKFDISTQIDLCKELPELGITDIFNGSIANFSTLSESSNGIAIKEAIHCTRITIDEKGVSGASYSIKKIWESEPPIYENKLDFKVDKPFIFVITSEIGTPLFVGLVNKPV